MYDGISYDAATIHENFPNAEMVAYYVDGIYAWTPEEIALFPHAVHVLIAISAGTNAGYVLDVENGLASPDQTEGWIRMRKAAGVFRPTVYCNLSTVPAVRAGTGAYVLGVDYDLWVADYDGLLAGVYPGEAAKQYTSDSSWDISEVYDAAWPHLHAPAPAKPPVPLTTYPAPGNLKAPNVGPHSVRLTWAEPDHGNLPAPEYAVFIYDVSSGAGPSVKDIVSHYPRSGVTGLSYTGGSLVPGHKYTAHVVASGKLGARSRPNTYASVSFQTPAS
jgi:Fibronectin type III domain